MTGIAMFTFVSARYANLPSIALKSLDDFPLEPMEEQFEAYSNSLA